MNKQMSLLSAQIQKLPKESVETGLNTSRMEN